MLAQQIITDVRKELLEYGAQNFWSDAELLRYLNRGQSDFVNRTRLLEDSASVTLTQGRQDYPLPGNWLSARLVMLQIPNADGTNRWSRVSAYNLEKIAQENGSFLDNSIDNQGTPYKYYIWGTTLNLVPAPSAENVGTLYLFYKSKPITLLSANQNLEIDDSLSEAMNAYVLWKAWSKEKEQDLADTQKQTYLEYVAEGRRWAKKKNELNRFDISSSSSFTSNPTNIFNS